MTTRAPSDANRVDPLTALAIRHGTDKWGMHFYTPIYHELFAHLRKEPVRLLEIGIGGYESRTVGGASLRMWADYFPHGRIVGIDVAPKAIAFGPRITTLFGSQDDSAFLDRLSAAHGPFEIIIDDGSHRPEHVAASFYALFPHLVDRGRYVIEDVQTTFWSSLGGSARNGGGTMKLARSLLEYLNHTEIKVERPKWQPPELATQVRSLRAYHNLIVIEKGDNSEPSNYNYKLDNPHVARALCTIEDGVARAPTPEGCANLLEVLARVKKFAEVDKLLADTLMKWPEHPAVLVAAANAALERGDARGKLGYMERLAKLEPGNALLQKSVDRLKAMLGKAAVEGHSQPVTRRRAPPRLPAAARARRRRRTR